jgi:ABC-type dipeptide/oligopeptide/nickel transport system permease component
MLKEAVRRLLWLGPTLLVVTLPIFWAIARATDLTARAPSSPLPLFFNPSPAGVRERALAAVSLVVAGGETAGDGAETLSRLGGAALPYVLAQFDALGPDARGRVALSLAPIARRMGIGAGADLDTPEAAVVLWNRFWEEHAIDFRPAVVRRAVRRFVEHPSALRASEVSELDTIALEDLVDALGAVKTAEDAIRVRHVADLLAHMTDRSWTVPPGAPLEAAARVADRYRHWWQLERSTYLAFTGPRRLVATVLETRYGRWVEGLVRRGTGSAGSGRMTSELRAGAPTTLALLFSGLFVGYPLAVLGGIVAALHRTPLRSLLLSAATLALSTAGVAGIAAVLSAAQGWKLFWACAATATATAAASVRHRKTLSRRVFELPHLRTERAYGASALRVALRAVRLTGASVAALAAADIPGVLTSALVAEHVFGLRGIGATTVEALRKGDQAWLLTVAVAGTLSVGIAQIAADLLLAALDPRVRSRAARHAEALE